MAKSSPIRILDRGFADVGIVAIKGGTVSSSGRYGWQTGFDRILYTTSSTVAGSAQNLEVTLVGWKNSTLRSQVFKMTIDPAGAVSQSVFGPSSPPNQIWARVGVFPTATYVYDVQSHSVKKYIDTGSDGIPDASVNSFSVALPVGPHDRETDPENWSMSLDLDPFLKFYRRAVGGATVEVLLRHVGAADTRPIAIVPNGQGGYALSRVGNAADLSDTISLAIGGNLSGGQGRIAVFGSPGKTFVVKKESNTGQHLDISKKWTVPIGEIVFVDLSLPLQPGWRIRVEAVDASSVHSVWRRVVGSSSPVILPLRDELASEGETIEIEIDQWDNNCEVFFDHNGTQYPLSTPKMGAGRLKAKIPDIGLVGTNAPFLSASMTKLYIRHKVTHVLRSLHSADIRISYN